jgi:dihydrofolate reductase
MTSNNGIGRNNTIPWSDKEDMNYFRTITSAKSQLMPVILMGYATWKSIGKALSGRINVVITKTHLDETSTNVIFRNDLHTTLIEYQAHNLFVIGGQDIYTEYLKYHIPTVIHQTITKAQYECDRQFPVHLIDYLLYSSSIVRENDQSITYQYRLKDS